MTELTATHEQRLHAYIDGELSASERAEVEQLLARDAKARAYVDGLRLLQGAFVAGLEAEAAKVPEARFEQIWDEIDRTIAKDGATPAAAPSFWSRVRAAFKPLRVPAMVAAGAAAVAVIGMRLGSGDAVNQDTTVASVPEVAPTQPEAKSAPTPPTSPAPAIAEALPAPKAADAEIHGVDFGGKNGRISHTGVVTVLYVEDDTTPKSERSL